MYGMRSERWMTAESKGGKTMSNSQGMYRDFFEHDNCGIGACVNIKGKKTHKTVENALCIVENLEHRAGKDGEGKTGDGVGILLQISHKFFKKVCSECGIELGEEREYGVGMFFFPQNELKRNQAKKMFEVIACKEGIRLLGWREVPVSASVLGAKARECMPSIWQVFLEKPQNIRKGLEFDRRLYVIRKEFELSSEHTYVCSLSGRTIVYKGMFLVGQLRTFFDDLRDADHESAIALVHSRFSTNTNPSWERAHPNRFIVHNGEINTIKGNADKMLAREETMESGYFAGEMHKLLPVVNTSGSDSAMLDNTLEFLVMNGMELPLAVMIAIPEPWANNQTLTREKRDFYQYYATMMEPWDGPASILFSDGDVMGAVLDRNGLRPSRYYITSDDDLILSSEVGVLDIPEEKIVLKERLHPGKMLVVDTVVGRLIGDDELKESYAARQPYGEWLDSALVELSALKIPNERIDEYRGERLKQQQRAFGYTYEEYRTDIYKMALDGSENIGAMGRDTPLRVLSGDDEPLFSYFKQLFAQVTNPPIDAIREKIVTGTTVYVGSDGNLLEEKPDNCRVLKIERPILTNTDMLKIKRLSTDTLRSEVIPMTYYKGTRLERAIERLFIDVDSAYAKGANLLILSDRGVDENHVPIPSLLAVSAVHQHLVRMKKRTSVSIILESGEPRTVHHFATLLGYGVCAVNPYVALDTIRELIEDGLLQKDYYAAVTDYTEAVLSGIIKIASKMGISTIQSYLGARIFEAVGLSEKLVNDYFAGTISRVGGIGLKQIERRSDRLHSSAFDPLGLDVDLELDSAGAHKAKSDGDTHRYDPRTISLLQESTRLGDYELFKQYTQLADREEHGYLRSLMEFDFKREPVAIDEVESVEEIVKRFKTGAMSYGSISAEAHETLAVAMNRLGGKSNTGEGGESEERLDSAGTKHDRCSAIKQVASGRFGVTSRYLVSAKEIQIKMAQGAKPGEGGHLPSKKVYPWVAKTRHSTPGVSLISPPPHHDIYSIEDLAQLIYDLKNANKHARISVKLVAEAGVGTVAAGVAKAGAEVILISGYDGGTGAAPISSIHHAGIPWEMGLAEAHQTLIKNGLRNRVIIETDGKLMTGRDVAIAALLGAQEYGFATAPLVVIGCVMMRVCNLDTCPMGVATQNPQLRKCFRGRPEYVENFMRFVAQELREYMAKLGFRTVDEMVGRTDMLRQKKETALINGESLDLSAILNNPYSSEHEKIRFSSSEAFDFELDKTLDETKLIRELSASLKKKQKKCISVRVTNTDRAFGTMFGSEITRLYKYGLPEDTFIVDCTGAGGQSFGAFIPAGLTLSLTGDSNDYFGKGLSGGKLILRQSDKATYKADENIIVGNVALYGATGGKAFISGVAGERFAVRNSGARAVVEGVGDHGCEYMTGGRVVVLGSTGKNFAAGMSGGIAYVLDEKNRLYQNMNKSMVSIEKVESAGDESELRRMIEEHVRETGSVKGAYVLEHFEEMLPMFKKIIPNDFKKMTALAAKMQERGMSEEEAQVAAFYESVGQKV